MKNRALIFDIRRFSIHDGAGIRTTIFFKGCPLHCIWCQNPEGIEKNARLVHFPAKCVLCNYCIKLKDNAVTMENNTIIVDNSKVIDAAEYEYICPTGALRMDSKYYSSDELMTIVKKDMPFFKYGGGVTLSGGEPFFQADFIIKFLEKLQLAGIHTAVETSFFTTWEKIEQALPFIDTLFVDFKIYDNDKHKKYTNVDNTLIKNNIKKILQSRYSDRVIIRTPLIPEYTATKENLTHIASSIVNWNKDVKYELLNYNPLARVKYQHVDYDYCFVEDKPLYTQAEMNSFYSIIKEAGIKNFR